jgi:hypothetical protein
MCQDTSMHKTNTQESTEDDVYYHPGKACTCGCGFFKYYPQTHFTPGEFHYDIVEQSHLRKAITPTGINYSIHCGILAEDST